MTPGSIPSPNHTTPGRSSPPHSAHSGGMGRGTRKSLASAPQQVHLTVQMEPWYSSTVLLPAAWW